MRRLVIIYNIAFLIAGNFLLSHVHFSHEHPNEHPNHECNECILIENSNNYILYYNEPLIEKNKGFKFILDNIINLISSSKIPSSSRAPPIS